MTVLPPRPCVPPASIAPSRRGQTPLLGVAHLELCWQDRMAMGQTPAQNWDYPPSSLLKALLIRWRISATQAVAQVCPETHLLPPASPHFLATHQACRLDLNSVWDGSSTAPDGAI